MQDEDEFTEEERPEPDDGGLRGDIRAAFGRLRMEPADEDIDALARYLELIEHWNARINLTAIRDRPTAILRHLVEPVLGLDTLAGAGPRVLDAGSGVGVPGIPLAIFDRERDYLLVEAHARKVAFLEEVAETLGLDHVQVIEARLEEAIAAETLTGPIHVLTSRGWTSGWGNLLGVMAPLMAPGGRALLYTGENTERLLRQHLSRGTDRAQPRDPEWQAAAAAGWALRRARPLPHLGGRGFLVSLVIPTP